MAMEALSVSENPQPIPPLFVECPCCHTRLMLEAADLASLMVGDALVCEGCTTEVEVLSLNPPALARLGHLVDCPHCHKAITLDPETRSNERVECPHCEKSFTATLASQTSPS
jgi:uncharacterized protein YbaR (Trm112 family)